MDRSVEVAREVCRQCVARQDPQQDSSSICSALVPRLYSTRLSQAASRLIMVLEELHEADQREITLAETAVPRGLTRDITPPM
jgi:hypothetical protein